MSETPDIADGEAAPGFEVEWPPETWLMPLRRTLKTKADETIASLSLREPTMDEFEQIMRHPAETRRRFSVSLIAGLPMSEVAKIGVGDVVRAEAYLTSFFDVGQVIGVGSERS